MTDRATSGGTLPNACPFLALEEDRDRRSAVPDGRHRCYADPAPQPRALTYQETFCLSPAFPSCRSFLEWAARAAAEPVRGQGGAAGPVPLAPIPAPVTPAPVPPAAQARQPLVPALPSVNPPPPTGSSPLPTWRPPGTPPTDTTGFTWAMPPPWVAEPEMRSTASLPDSARPPLDAERLGWPTSGTTGAMPPAPLDEDPDGYPEWPPAPRSGGPTEAYGDRRSEPFGPLPPAPDEDRRDASATLTLTSAAIPEDDDTRWIGPVGPAAPTAWGPSPALPTASGVVGVTTGPAAVVSDWGAWTDQENPPGALPQQPFAIKVGDGPTAPPPGDVAWQGVLGEPGGQPPVEPAPRPMPGAQGAPPHDASPGGRRGPSSRWLPSFLSREPREETGTAALAARTGPAPAISASSAMVGDWPEDVVAGTAVPDSGDPPASGTWAAPAAVETGTVPTVATVPAVPTADPSVATGALPTASTGAANLHDEDPPGSLAPRRRRRLSVPVDAAAPTETPHQTRPATRAKGSGEWETRRKQPRRTGWRRIVPGVIPPVALGAIGLFLAAALLFAIPGFLATPAATPPPSLPLDEGGIAASLRPDRTSAPRATVRPQTGFKTYKVERGDTLIDIARRFAVTQEVLVCANRQLRRNPNLITPGQQLQVPPEGWQCPSQAKPTKKP